MDDTERTEELLSHFAEGELEPEERQEVEDYLKAHPEGKAELHLEKALMDRLAALPGEVAPSDFARKILDQTPPLPGGLLHQTEVTLRRLLMPGLAAASIMAAALFMVSAGAPGESRRPSVVYPPIQVASLTAGSGGVRLGDEAVPAGRIRTMIRGQRLVVPDGSSATLQVDEGVEVTVGGGTELLLDPRVVHLQEGLVDVYVRPGIGNFVVHGPLASARVVGTRFKVAASKAETTVEVAKGIVEVKAISGGKTTQLLAGGKAAVRSARPSGLAVEGPHRDRGEPLVVQPTQPTDRPVAGFTESETSPATTPEGLPSLDSN